MESGSVWSYWIPVIPEGKMVIDSIGIGVASASLGLWGLIKGEDVLDRLKDKRTRADRMKNSEHAPKRW